MPVQLLSIEKGGAVPYTDLVTILRLSSMQYLQTKLAMLQSEKPGSHLTPNDKIMCPQEASVRTAKISLFIRIYSPIRSLWTNKYYSIYTYLFALKPFKFTYMKKQFSSIWRLENSYLLVTSQNSPYITHGNN